MPTFIRLSSRSMHFRLSALLTLALLCLLSIGIQSSSAFPKPSAVPQRWELDFSAGPLRLYTDPLDGDAYWYFTYTVINNTGRDQLWVPSFDLFTDAGEIIPGGDQVPARITSAIRAMLGNELLETQREALGDILQGEEHAIDGLIVWPLKDQDVNILELFIAGVSGETARVVHPRTGEEVILRKSIHRRYLVRGNAIRRGSEPVELVKERWILR